VIRRSAHSSAGTAVLRSRPPPAAPKPNLASRLRWAIAFAAVVASSVYLTSSVLSVLVAAAVVAYLLHPVVTRLQARGYRRVSAIFLIGIAAALVGALAVLVVVPGFVRNVGALGGNVTPYLDGLAGKAQPVVGWLENRFDVVIPLDLRALAAEIPVYLEKLSPDARSTMKDYVGRLAGGGIDVVLAVLRVTLLPVFAFYLLRDWPDIVGWVHELVPPRHRPVVRSLAAEIDIRIISFVKGQLLVAGILAAWYTVALLLAGLKFGVTMGILSGALFLLPYVGPLAAATMSVGLTLLEYGFDWHVLAVAAAYGFGQVLENTFLTPMLVGDRVGLHPLVVIVAIIAAGELLGLWGLVVALPVTAAFAVVGGHVLEEYRRSRTFLG
jgi:predicted PurR-regulated permease PerM